MEPKGKKKNSLSQKLNFSRGHFHTLLPQLLQQRRKNKQFKIQKDISSVQT